MKGKRGNKEIRTLTQHLHEIFTHIYTADKNPVMKNLSRCPSPVRISWLDLVFFNEFFYKRSLKSKLYLYFGYHSN